jgi:hypothetical protein
MPLYLLTVEASQPVTVHLLSDEASWMVSLHLMLLADEASWMVPMMLLTDVATSAGDGAEAFAAAGRVASSDGAGAGASADYVSFAAAVLVISTPDDDALAVSFPTPAIFTPADDDLAVSFPTPAIFTPGGDDLAVSFPTPAIFTLSVSFPAQCLASSSAALFLHWVMIGILFYFILCHIPLNVCIHDVVKTHISFTTNFLYRKIMSRQRNEHFIHDQCFVIVK